MGSPLAKYLDKPTEAAPLAVFRIFFGLMMVGSLLRFWANGWIEKLYLEPTFHFSYYGFEWVRPLGAFTYVIFLVCGLSALGVALGFKYRLSILTFFLSFTYIELMDKTTYLNHYYFISCVSFLMLFLPAHRYFSVDAWRNKKLAAYYIPSWTIDSIKVLLGIVYFYAGLAKLNSDWLFRAMPLKIWLPSNYDLPLLGTILQEEWAHFAFSWSGALYDLSIPFLLLYRKTRWFAFAMVVIFHVLTRVLFPIGIFPFVMIVSTLIFFDAKFHHRILLFLSGVFRIGKEKWDAVLLPKKKEKTTSMVKWVVALFIGIQFLLPWRYVLYPGELFWTEEGFRFSWRVMLMEKAGYAQFKVVNPATGNYFYVDNSDFLTPFQEKQMSFQPDFILEYAHFLGDQFKAQGHGPLEIYVESYVALNGRMSQPFVYPTVNLLNQRESFAHKTWIVPFQDEIKGL
ncbi:MAG: HTTM domain-containing protein [Flavobacteriaceae bacterium]|nr:HTTM domain-containing protein [Flavobacteriaceae bacterium]